MIICNACGSSDLELVYKADSVKSITTMNTYINGALQVYLCGCCGHCQTLPLEDLKSYYEEVYELGRQNENDDQLYLMVAGEPVFRAQHQAAVLLDKVMLDQYTSILDFGCGKSLTMGRLCKQVNGLKPYVYDVSDRYRDMWKTFTLNDHCAVRAIPPSWASSFDVITSFYALEHIVELQQICSTIQRLLKNEGQFYFIVPNVLGNPADFLVVDHVNHFSPNSIAAMLSRAGFELIEVDGDSHIGALICRARKPAIPSFSTSWQKAELSSDPYVKGIRDYALFWHIQEVRLRELITMLSSSQKIAIYGAGFYGVYLSSLLRDCDKELTCFLDSNPFLQGTQQAGIPILSPSQLPEDISTIMVGLNPVHARNIIASVESFANKNLEFIYIEA